VTCYDGTNWELSTIGNAPAAGGVTSVNTLTGAAVVEAATAGQMAVSGGASAALTGAVDMTYSTHTFATTTNGIFDWSAATGTAAFKVPQTTTNTTTAAGVIDFDTTNKNYHGYVNGADSMFLNSAAALTTNFVPKTVIASGNMLMANSLLSDTGTVLGYTGTGGITVGTPPTVTTPGTGFYAFGTEGTEPASVASGTSGFNMDSTSHCPIQYNNAVNVGCSTANNGVNTAGTSMTLNMSAATGATALQVPVIAGATAGADGVVDYDSTGKATHIRTDGADSLAIAQVCKTSQKSETTTADANVLTCAPAAVAGTYRISFVVSVSAATSGVIGWTATWTDSNGAAQTPVELELFQNATAAPALTFTTSVASNYHGSAMIDVNSAGTNIVVKWIGGGTTTAKVSAMVERVI
jgi:hypothetical protein